MRNWLKNIDWDNFFMWGGIVCLGGSLLFLYLLWAGWEGVAYILAGFIGSLLVSKFS